MRLTVQQMVKIGQLDEAIKLHQKQREATISLGKKLDADVRRLADLRTSLKRNTDNQRAAIKKLLEELHKSQDNESWDSFVGGLFGDDPGAGEVSDALCLSHALRRDVVEKAVVFLLRSENEDQCGDP